MRCLFVLTVFSSCLILGCTSFHTTAIGRLENDSLFKDCLGRKQKAKGIPVKMKVPTHIIVKVYEQQILVQDGKNGNTEIKLHSFDPPQYEIETEKIYTDKVFLVDFLRPAGGELNLVAGAASDQNGINFDSSQYFSGIQASVKEQTMEDIGAALETIGAIPATLAEKTSAGMVKSDEVLTNVSFEKSIVACQRFDLARPDWEMELNAFVGNYTARCRKCCKTSSTLPGGAETPELPPQPNGKHSAGTTPGPFKNQLGIGFRPEAPPALEMLE